MTYIETDKSSSIPPTQQIHVPKRNAGCPFSCCLPTTYATVSCVDLTGRGFHWLQDLFSFCAGCIGKTAHLISLIAIVPLRLGRAGCGMLSGLIGFGTYKISSMVKSAAVSAAHKTIHWVKNNWKQIIAYILAWSIVVTCSGLLYGFEAVALPLTIGLGCGLVAGALVGLLMTTAIDPKDKWRGKNTAWDLLNMGIDKLDQNGTRQIVLAISVTVLLAASVIFPYALGAVFGLLVGNQVVTKIGFGRNLGHDANDHHHRLRELERKIRSFQQELQDYRHQHEHRSS